MNYRLLRKVLKGIQNIRINFKRFEILMIPPPPATPPHPTTTIQTSLKLSIRYDFKMKLSTLFSMPYPIAHTICRARQPLPYTVPCLPGYTIYHTMPHAMPVRPYHIPCHARQAITYTMPCPPGYRMYHVMPVKPYYIPCRVDQA